MAHQGPYVQRPYGFNMTENCKLSEHNFFCQLDGPALKDFDSLTSLSAYPSDAVLFIEQELPRGIFVLCEGQIKLSICSSEGKTLILNIAGPGDVLGLVAVIDGIPYEVTAETLRPSRIAFVKREDFLKFVKRHPNVYLNIAKHIASSYEALCEQLRIVGLASIPKRLAKVLLDWSERSGQEKPRSRVMMPLTHREIGELIGSTRETVTRTLSDFEDHHLIAVKGAAVTIQDRKALEEMAAA
jgi:CRP/FNR family transcriptional regulator, cyclic AMP receptor protein